MLVNLGVRNGGDSALYGGRPEEPLALRRKDVEEGVDPPCALADDGDPVRVAAELDDVVPDPLEGELDVPEGEVAREDVVTHAEEAEGAETVVEADQDLN